MPQFQGAFPAFSDAGRIKLVWGPPDGSSPAEGVEFQLQQSKDPGFGDAKTIYAGPDLASFISGLPNGEFHYRVRGTKEGAVGAWSTPVLVTVEHQSLQLAFTLLGLGAIVFIATLMVIFFGNRRAAREAQAVNAGSRG